MAARCPDHARRLAHEVLADAAVPDGNLQAYIRSNPVREEATFFAMVLQLLKGVIALVDAALLHRDIKLDNVLVRLDPAGGPPALLLADFGTLQPMANQDRGCTPGNPVKVAPELRTLHDIGREAAAAVDLTKAEVWAVGALCFDLLETPAPYERTDSTSLPESPAVSALGRVVVSRMLAWEVPQRLSSLGAAVWVEVCQGGVAQQALRQGEQVQQLQAARQRCAEVERTNAQMHAEADAQRESVMALRAEVRQLQEMELQELEDARQALARKDAELLRCQQALGQREARIAQLEGAAAERDAGLQVQRRLHVPLV